MRLITKGRSIFLAYDQGLEHGPTDFNDKNVDPEYILEIALKAKLNGVILQKGVAEKYYKKKYASVPLILKLNGKTNIVKGDPVSRQLCTVKEAKKLGAKAVGYTIYLGSIHEEEMFVEFEKIEREARKAKLPVIAWIYPRGKAVKNPQSREMQAYAARVGLELGADMIKMHVSTNFNDFRWAVKSAGKARVLVAGGKKITVRKLLENTKEYLKAGASGIAIGRNIWQHKDPVRLARALKKIVYDNRSVREAMKGL